MSVTTVDATTVDAATVAEREPDAATAAEKSAVTLNYEAMLAALNDLLAEIREVAAGDQRAVRVGLATDGITERIRLEV